MDFVEFAQLLPWLVLIFILTPILYMAINLPAGLRKDRERNEEIALHLGLQFTPDGHFARSGFSGNIEGREVKITSWYTKHSRGVSVKMEMKEDKGFTISTDRIRHSTRKDEDSTMRDFSTEFKIYKDEENLIGRLLSERVQRALVESDGWRFGLEEGSAYMALSGSTRYCQDELSEMLRLLTLVAEEYEKL